MKKPEQVPEAVKAALVRYNKQHPTANVTEEELGWDSLSGYYYFTRAGMFHGVELDGHIHT